MNETMNRFDKLLKMPDSTGFDNEADLVAFIRKAPIGTRAGLVFRFDKTRNVNVVTIRLYTKNRWGVETLWGIPRIGIRKRLDKTGSYLAPGYYSRGFVMIQNAVFRAFYPSLKFNQTIHIARMPVKASTDDAFVELIFSVIIVYIFVFCYSLSGSISVGNFAIIVTLNPYIHSLIYSPGDCRGETNGIEGTNVHHGTPKLGQLAGISDRFRPPKWHLHNHCDLLMDLSHWQSRGML